MGLDCRIASVPRNEVVTGREIPFRQYDSPIRGGVLFYLFIHLSTVFPCAIAYMSEMCAFPRDEIPARPSRLDLRLRNRDTIRRIRQRREKTFLWKGDTFLLA